VLPLLCFIVLYFQYSRTIDVPIITPTATLTYTLSCLVMLNHTLLYLPIYARASRHKLLGIERILIGIIILRDESKKNWNIV
jgi:hypothetical protein